MNWPIKYLESIKNQNGIVNAFDDIQNNALNLEIVKKPITLSKLLQIIQQHLR